MQQKRYQTKTRTGLRANLPLSTEPADHGRNGAEGWTISPTLNKRKTRSFLGGFLYYHIGSIPNLIKFKQRTIYFHIYPPYKTKVTSLHVALQVLRMSLLAMWLRRKVGTCPGVVLGGWCLACFSWRVVRFFQFCFVLHSFWHVSFWSLFCIETENFTLSETIWN